MRLSTDWAFTVAIIAIAAAGSGGAGAQDLKVGSDSSYIQIYGQFDKGFLHYDDGGTRELYPLVDNDSSSTRFGVLVYELADNGLAFGGNLEFEWEPYSTGEVNQLTGHDVDIAAVGLRNAEVYLSYRSFGKLWVGHGNMASDGTSEVDLSGTSLAGYSSVGDIAGAQLFRLSGGALSDIQIYDAFSNLDGLGRKTRMRYDTPESFGFSLGTSMDIDGNWDGAVRYRGKSESFTVAAQAAYANFHEEERQRLNGSLSILHDPTGLSLTLAAGRDMLEASELDFIYGKFGYQVRWFDLGKTYFSVDAYSGEDINVDGSRSYSYGFAMVQNAVAWSTDYYLGLRRYRYDHSGASYQDGLAVILGARLSF